MVANTLPYVGLKSSFCRGMVLSLSSDKFVLTATKKTTEEKVLLAAKEESKNITLVYASEKAMEFKLETQMLPGPLDVCCSFP